MSNVPTNEELDDLLDQLKSAEDAQAPDDVLREMTRNYHKALGEAYYYDLTEVHRNAAAHLEADLSDCGDGEDLHDED